MRRWFIHRADLRLLEVIRDFPDNHFDALFCDAPYALTDGRALTWDDVEAARRRGGFMGAQWDSAMPGVTFWRECLRVLKPGAPIAVFGGSRTYHRLAGAIENAGFELRDEIADFLSERELAQRFYDSLEPEQRAAFDEAFRGSPYVHWIYATGFPKSLDNERAVSCAVCTLTGRHFASTLPKLDKREAGDHLCPTSAEGERFEGGGTALKPAHEPIVLARKPLDGTVAENLLKWGVGGLAIDACRIATDWSDRSEAWKRSGHSSKPDAEKIAAPAGNGIECHAAGRYPANVVLEHTSRCVARGTKRVRGSNAIGPSPGETRGSGFGYRGGRGKNARDYVGDDGLEAVAAWNCASDCPVRLLDAQSGALASHGGGTRTSAFSGEVFGRMSGGDEPIPRGDSGGASRFFYCAKANRAERDLGCEQSAAETMNGARNTHPTVKPIETCVYCAKLMLPPPRVDDVPRRLLVPCSGSGSEMIGALRAGWDEVVGLEIDPHFIAIAEARLARWDQVPAHVEPAEAKPEKTNERQASLFGGSR